MSLDKDLKVYAITHRDYMKNDFLEAIKNSIEGGITMLQIREKNLDDNEFKKIVLEVLPLCKSANIPLIINDNMNILSKVEADGIHIGQDDAPLSEVRKKFPDKIIGVSVNSLEQAKEAEKNGASYLGVGAMYNTSTKLDADTVSYSTLKEICENVNIPVCAIGGITAENIHELRDSGIAGVSVISEIYNKKDKKKATQDIKNAVDNILIKNVLTIAGSDSSGGAGIQADLKTFTAHKKYGMSVITAITAQNTMSVDYIEEISKEGVEAQLESVFNDIVPDSIKIGMVSNSEIIKSISEKLKKFSGKNIVLDPVMVSTSGCSLINEEAIDALKKYLFPLAKVITPNIPEAELLIGSKIKNEKDMIEAATKIGKEHNIACLVKGGHLVNDATDVLYEKGEVKIFSSPFVESNNTHGTGCTLSSAIASNLADGYSLSESIKLAKDFLVGALKNDLNLGKGSGPLNHIYNIEREAW